MAKLQGLVVALLCMVASIASAAAAPPTTAPGATTAPPVSPQVAQDTPPTCELRKLGSGDESERALLDAHVATATQRQGIFAAYERCAERGVPYAQDIVGSLYYMGSALPDALVAQDIAKARLYLANAATRGVVGDMAKMAEIELAQKNDQAAMVWAQLYGHYSGSASSTGNASGYFAGLLKRIFQSAPSNMASVNDDLNAFVTQHDSAIRAYAAKAGAAGADMKWATTARVATPLPSYTGESSGPCYADFLVAFNPNGSLAGKWMIDAFPSAACGRSLLPGLSHLGLVASSQSELRYVILPVIYSDGRVQLAEPAK